MEKEFIREQINALEEVDIITEDIRDAIGVLQCAMIDVIEHPEEYNKVTPSQSRSVSAVNTLLIQKVKELDSICRQKINPLYERLRSLQESERKAE